jgi:hypothetical protein
VKFHVLFTHGASHSDFTLAFTRIVQYSVSRDINLAAAIADRADAPVAKKTL